MPGWDEIEEMTGEGKPHSKNDDINKLILRVFATEDGQRLMAWWRENLLEQPVAVPGSSSDFAYYREGQNSVIRDLEARIKRARNL